MSWEWNYEWNGLPSSFWIGFWAFIILFFCVDLKLHRDGMNTLFWEYKTPEEKEIQRAIIERLKGAQRGEG